MKKFKQMQKQFHCFIIQALTFYESIVFASKSCAKFAIAIRKCNLKLKLNGCLTGE